MLEKAFENEVVSDRIPSHDPWSFFCGVHLAKILFLSGFFQWNSGQKEESRLDAVARSIEIELWGRLFWCPTAKNLGLFSSQMQNWPSVADLRTRGGRTQSSVHCCWGVQQTFSRYFGLLWLRGDQRVQIQSPLTSHVTFLKCFFLETREKIALYELEKMSVKFGPEKLFGWFYTIFNTVGTKIYHTPKKQF